MPHAARPKLALSLGERITGPWVRAIGHAALTVASAELDSGEVLPEGSRPSQQALAAVEGGVLMHTRLWPRSAGTVTTTPIDPYQGERPEIDLQHSAGLESHPALGMPCERPFFTPSES